MNAIKRCSREERFNTFTHLGGVLFTLGAAWIILKLGYESNWKNAFGTTTFTYGMLLMYADSSLYHWCLHGKCTKRLRILDHINIHLTIEASNTHV